MTGENIACIPAIEFLYGKIGRFFGGVLLLLLAGDAAAHPLGQHFCIFGQHTVIVAVQLAAALASKSDRKGHRLPGNALFDDGNKLSSPYEFHAANLRQAGKK